MDAKRLSEAIVRLVELAQRLRGPDGCPWDAKQTDQSVKNYLLEEAYEVVDAIDKGDSRGVCAELGDLLFQIVFLAQLASERGEFDMADVIENIEEKMIRRHPHVFGHVSVESAEEVARNWAKIKETEGERVNTASSALANIPLALPALLRAHRLCERASKMNFDWSKIEDPEKIIRNGMKSGNIWGPNGHIAEKEEGLGEILFAFVELIRQQGGNAEDLLREANARFVKRFEEMEKALEQQGTDLKHAGQNQLREAWEKAGQVARVSSSLETKTKA